jgi:phosphatidylinositol-3-phosphatase
VTVGAAALLLLLTLAVVRSELAKAADPDADSRAQALASQPCGGSFKAPRQYQHVIWIWMENKSFQQVIGSEDAPFENTLAEACGLATDYHAISHPTLPNYLAATAGRTFGVSQDRLPPQKAISARNIFGEVAASGRQWRTYYDSMANDCHPMGGYNFARNPVAWFRGDRGRCARWNVTMGSLRHGSLVRALDGNRLPTFSLLVPNLCHSTHSCPIAAGDTWLSRWINRIVTSPSYRHGSTAVFLTWDEGRHDLGQHIPLIVISPSTRPDTTSTLAFNHYSLLRTTAGLLDVRPPGHAATAGSMAGAFGL